MYSINRSSRRANPDTLIGRLALGHRHDVMFDKTPHESNNILFLLFFSFPFHFLSSTNTP